MNMIRRIIGKKGRTTIPFPMRQMLGIRENDVVAYSLNEDKSAVIVTKEQICDGCMGVEDDITSDEVVDFVDSLPEKFQEAILVKLFDKYCSKPKSGNARRVTL